MLGLLVSGGNTYVSDSRMEKKCKRGEAKDAVSKIVTYSVYREKYVR